MGFGNFLESESSATDQTLDASGADAIAFRGSAGTLAREGAVAVGKGGKLVSPGALDLSKFKGKSLTINQSDPGVIQSALDRVTALGASFAAQLSSLAGQGNTASAAQLSSQQAALDKALQQIGTLSESKQTEGVSGLQKSALFMLLIIVGGAALVVYLFKKVR